MVRKYKLNNSCTTYVVYPKKKKKKISGGIKPNSLIGERVYSRFLGLGIVVSATRDICTIQYAETKIQCYKNNLVELIKASKKYDDLDSHT